MELENLIVRGGKNSEESPDCVLQEKRTEQFFETLVADPDNTIRTCHHIKFARVFESRHKAKMFMYENQLDSRFKTIELSGGRSKKAQDK